MVGRLLIVSVGLLLSVVHIFTSLRCRPPMNCNTSTTLRKSPPATWGAAASSWAVTPHTPSPAAASTDRAAVTLIASKTPLTFVGRTALDSCRSGAYMHPPLYCGITGILARGIYTVGLSSSLLVAPA